MVIDEIQRVPELLLPIKVQVDGDPRAGRYLLSGSARVLGLRALPDTLPGRMETIELWPFSQGEIDETADSFIDAVFTQGEELRHHLPPGELNTLSGSSAEGSPRQRPARTYDAGNVSSTPTLRTSLLMSPSCPASSGRHRCAP